MPELHSVGQEHSLSSLSPEDTALSQSAAHVAAEVGKLADQIEHEWRRGRGDLTMARSRPTPYSVRADILQSLRWSTMATHLGFRSVTAGSHCLRKMGPGLR